MNRNLLATAALVLGLTASACGGGAMYVSSFAPPPAPHAAVVGVAPGPGFVWIDGFYEWGGGGYRWVAGRWVRPPRRGALWVAPYWGQERRGWTFHRGYWR